MTQQTNLPLDQTPTLEQDDVRLIARLRQKRQFIVPDEAFEKCPAEAFRIASDDSLSPAIRLAAMRELRAQIDSNRSHDKLELNLHLGGRTAEDPPTPAGDVVEGIAFHHQPEQSELAQMVDIAKQLPGVLKSLQGPSGDPE